MNEFGVTLAPSRNANFVKQSGFTLIELMIVVGVIGILVSISVPQYTKYQRKARQSEAKIALGAMYALEKSFYAEYSAYIPALDAIGYAPEGTRQFYYHGACWSPPWSGSVTGYAGAHSVTQINTVGNPYTWSWAYQAGNTCVTLTSGCGTIGNDPQSITMATLVS